MPCGKAPRSGVTKASDMLSFGRVCIYPLGGVELLLLTDWKEMEMKDTKPEQGTLVRHFLYLRPLRGGLLDQVKDETWNFALKEACDVAEMTARDQPRLRLKKWGGRGGEEPSPKAKSMISRMTNLDPVTRTTMDEVLKHGWW
ncbi:hypothetical protein B0O99DRAFT_599762 [Bisporella sp. PMI_857]|nr:hypothetical protein B0O99DRAFT_599762 [Bisporella sp. PMI_857]